MTSKPDPLTPLEFSLEMRRIVLRGVIDEVIEPFCQLYETLIGDDPLLIGDYEVTIRRRGQVGRPRRARLRDRLFPGRAPYRPR
jgi:hypothetical protein